MNFNVPINSLDFWNFSWSDPLPCLNFLLEKQAIFIWVYVFLWPFSLVTETFMDDTITVICIRHRTVISSEKDLSKDMKWTYFED